MDINSLPSNSHKSREAQYHKPAKKVESVISGTTSTKKKNGIVRLADIFLPEDVESVKGYILDDVIIPKIKNMLHDIGAEAWDSFWGISGRNASRGSASRVSYISYDKYSGRNSDRQTQTQRRGLNYDDIIFSSRGDAELVLDRMADLCDSYQVVTIADMYELSDVSTDNYMFNKYGWTDVRDAKILRLSGGDYTIKMPKAMPIE